MNTSKLVFEKNKPEFKKVPQTAKTDKIRTFKISMYKSVQFLLGRKQFLETPENKSTKIIQITRIYRNIAVTISLTLKFNDA